MTSQPHGALRAPVGAIAWTATVGYLYETHEVTSHVEAGAVVLVVSHDGMLRGVLPHYRAPPAAQLRVETDLAEVVRAVDDLAARLEGADTGNAVEVAALKARVVRLERRWQHLR